MGQEGEFEGFGRDIGVALALVFIGQGDSKATNGARRSAMRLSDVGLYPEDDTFADNTEYIAFLDSILTEREEARKAGDEDFGIIASMEGRDQPTGMVKLTMTLRKISILSLPLKVLTKLQFTE